MATKSTAKAETTGIQISKDNFSFWVVGWGDDEVVGQLVEAVGKIIGSK